MLLFAFESIFVLTTTLLLKVYVFPFFIDVWFFESRLSSFVLEWTVLMIGTLTLFLYLGLGSAGKHQYQLTISKALSVFLIVHIPFLFFYQEWMSLLGDLFSLLLPKKGFAKVWLLLCYPVIFMLGRRFQVVK